MEKTVRHLSFHPQNKQTNKQLCSKLDSSHRSQVNPSVCFLTMGTTLSQQGLAMLQIVGILIEVLSFYTTHFSRITNMRVHFGIKIAHFDAGLNVIIVCNCQNKN